MALAEGSEDNGSFYVKALRSSESGLSHWMALSDTGVHSLIAKGVRAHGVGCVLAFSGIPNAGQLSDFILCLQSSVSVFLAPSAFLACMF